MIPMKYHFSLYFLVPYIYIYLWEYLCVRSLSLIMRSHSVILVKFKINIHVEFAGIAHNAVYPMAMMGTRISDMKLNPCSQFN